jgi:hypothetical protein
MDMGPIVPTNLILSTFTVGVGEAAAVVGGSVVVGLGLAEVAALLPHAVTRIEARARRARTSIDNLFINILQKMTG